MKYQHVQVIGKRLFYVNFLKHYCPTCHSRLKKIKVSQIVNSNSPEAANFDFHTVDTYMVGNVKFIWTEFYCPKCEQRFTVEEIRQIEKAIN